MFYEESAYDIGEEVWATNDGKAWKRGTIAESRPGEIMVRVAGFEPQSFALIAKESVQLKSVRFENADGVVIVPEFRMKLPPSISMRSFFLAAAKKAWELDDVQL